MANVNVTYEEMQQAAGQLNTGRVTIDEELARLSSLVDSLISGGYVTDRSSGAFESAFSEFSNGARQTIAGLEGMAKYLNTAADTFRDADSQLAQALKH